MLIQPIRLELQGMFRHVPRDLKPENILLGEDMHIQITDFGTAKIIENGEGQPSPRLETRRPFQVFVTHSMVKQSKKAGKTGKEAMEAEMGVQKSQCSSPPFLSATSKNSVLIPKYSLLAVTTQV